MILTAEELQALTGKQTRPAQRRSLDALGVRYGIRADGTLVVLNSSVEAALGPGIPKSRRKTSPNWDALNAAA